MFTDDFLFIIYISLIILALYHSPKLKESKNNHKYLQSIIEISIFVRVLLFI